MNGVTSLGLSRPLAALLVAGALLAPALPASAWRFETRTSIGSWYRPHRPPRPPAMHYPPAYRPHPHYWGYQRPSLGGAIIGGLAIGLMIGAIVSSLPPDCSRIRVNGVTYHSCGGTYYRPRYYGGDVEYVVVERP
jgi:hypothetical protein